IAPQWSARPLNDPSIAFVIGGGSLQLDKFLYALRRIAMVPSHRRAPREKPASRARTADLCPASAEPRRAHKEGPMRPEKIFWGCCAIVAPIGPSARADSLGQPFPGVDPTAFAESADAFADVEDINDGLGPTFNERSCGNCHGIPVLGGSGANVEQRFGR